MSALISVVEGSVPEEHRDLVFRFFLVFARFEYALKRAKFITKSGDKVNPNWDRFASDNNSAFDPLKTPELKEAVEYFKASPPRKQIVRDKTLGWSEPEKFETGPFLVWLLLGVRSVRNNLFHGGKFPLVPIDEPARNATLLKYALEIVEACIPLNADVKRHFTTID